MLLFFRRMWVGWNALVRGIVTAQSRVLMSVTWLVGLAPVALYLKLTGKRLIDRAPADPTAATYRNERDGTSMDMGRAARMF
ncbi:MAG: hypothetical protein ACK4YP_06530 [Myxococcota bacterium]